MRCCRTAVRLVRTLITCTILLLPSSARPLPPRRRLAAISTAAFAVLAPFPCWSSPSAAAVAVNVVGTIEPGYQLPPEQYASYATLLARQGVDVVPTPTTDGASIEEDANAAKNALGRGGRNAVKLLVGHSRGGAVAALAAAAAATAAAADAPAGPSLALLDPVDTADGATLRALASARRGPDRVLLVSLPYGGYSAYYKTAYESACAPAGRNGEAFYRAYAAALPPNHVLHVTVRNAGHLQLLDSRTTSRFAATCAANEAVSDTDVRGFVQALLVAWLRDAASTDGTAALVVTLPRLAAMYPQLQVTYVVNQ